MHLSTPRWSRLGTTGRIHATTPKAGVPLDQAVPQIGTSERGRWQLFDDYEPRDATTAFTELEWE